MKKISGFYFTVVFILVLSALNAFSQGASCGEADPICSNNTSVSFTAGVNSGSFGTSVGCLGSTPNPAWYVLKVGQSGRINIHMATTPSRDLDFACWGPFASATEGCGQLNLTGGTSHGPDAGPNPSDLGGYPIGNLIDCSFTAQSIEYVHIANAVAGQWYVLLVTNYSNQPCQINLNSDPSSTGTTNCAIISPPIGDTVCEGETATFSVSHPIAGASYHWDGPNLFTTVTDTIVTKPNIAPEDAGLYWLTIINPDGTLNDPDTCRLIVHSKPTMTVTTDSICVGEIATLTASGASDYHWNDNQTTANINVSPDTTTRYSVTGTSLFGCKDSVATQVVVFNNPQITVTPNTICSGELATAFAPNALSYSWDNGEITDTVRPLVSSQQIYKVTVIVPGGCRDSLLLTVNPNPIVEATASAICEGEVSTVTGLGASTYEWSNGQSGSIISLSPMSNMILSVIGTNDFGCKGYDTTTVMVYPKPKANFEPNTPVVTIEEGEITFNDFSTDATIWNYNFGEYNNSLNTSSEQSPTHKYLHVGSFKVWQVVSTEFGCMDSTYRRVQVEAPYFFYVPNAFTPDNDGKNEMFCPSGKGIDMNSYSMEIYDRWGTMVFHTNIPLGCWDGLINGARAPQGSYIYKINLKDMEAKHHDYMGDFIILR